MYRPSLKEFLRLSQRANLIPVYKEIRADLDTPVSAFLKLAKDEYAFLLESVEGQEKVARYSFLGTKPELVFMSKGRNIRLLYRQGQRRNSKHYITATSPLDEIRKIMQGFRPAEVKGLPRFSGGLVGYMGYDMARFFEKLPDTSRDDLKMPDALFMLTDSLLVFDRTSHSIKIIVNVMLPRSGPGLCRKKKIRAYIEALEKIEKISQQLNKPISEKEPAIKSGKPKIKVSSNLTRTAFENIVRKAKSYIRKGDIIQVVPSQRFMAETKEDPFRIYRRLRILNPSPYMFFFKLGDMAMAGSSPEMLVRCENGVIRTRPIAGTRPRGRNAKEDSRLERELKNDLKEKAEHIMLVDLGRNDLGRVCKNGGVKINEFMKIEKYSHVMHLVSEVQGILGRRHNIYDALRACFPAGTVSGSPKIRAMEIIEELENSKRGPYAGCVGYFSFSQNMDTCITIRTIVIKNRNAYVQAGCGIVADSVPSKEYAESVNKARALIEAIIN